MITINQLDSSSVATDYDKQTSQCIRSSVYYATNAFVGSLFNVKQPSDHVLNKCSNLLHQQIIQNTSSLSINIYSEYVCQVVCYRAGVLVTVYSSPTDITPWFVMLQCYVVDNGLDVSSLSLNQVGL